MTPRSTMLKGAVVGLMLVACSSGPTHEVPVATTIDATAGLAAWYDENSDVIDALSNATDAMSSSGDTADVDGMRLACGSLEEAASDGLSRDPVPSPEVERHWHAALRAFESAGMICVTATDTFDAAGLERAAERLSEGSDELGLARDALPS